MWKIDLFWCCHFSGILRCASSHFVTDLSRQRIGPVFRDKDGMSRIWLSWMRNFMIISRTFSEVLGQFHNISRSHFNILLVSSFRVSHSRLKTPSNFQWALRAPSHFILRKPYIEPRECTCVFRWSNNKMTLFPCTELDLWILLWWRSVFPARYERLRSNSIFRGPIVTHFITYLEMNAS